MLAEIHAFAMRFDTFGAIGDGLVGVFGVEVATVILYQAGRSAGASYYDRVLGRVESKESLLEAVGSFKARRGWGEVSFVDVDEDEVTGRVVIKDCFESKAGAKTRGCPFLRGYFAGFLTRYFEIEVCVVQERSAVDECVFPFMPSKFRHETPVKVELREQTSNASQAK